MRRLGHLFLGLALLVAAASLQLALGAETAPAHLSCPHVAYSARLQPVSISLLGLSTIPAAGSRAFQLVLTPHRFVNSPVMPLLESAWVDHSLNGAPATRMPLQSKMVEVPLSSTLQQSLLSKISLGGTGSGTAPISPQQPILSDSETDSEADLDSGDASAEGDLSGSDSGVDSDDAFSASRESHGEPVRTVGQPTVMQQVWTSAPFLMQPGDSLKYTTTVTADKLVCTLAPLSFGLPVMKPVVSVEDELQEPLEEAEPESEAEPEDESELEPEEPEEAELTEPEPEPEAELEPEPKPVVVVKPIAKPKPVTPKPKLKPKRKPHPKPTVKPTVKPVVKPKLKPKPKPVVVKPRPVVKPKPSVPAVKPRPTVTPKPMPTPTPEPKPVEVKPVVPTPAPAPAPAAPTAAAPIGCPAITFSHSLACGGDKCLVSFMNLHPTLPLDWVDMHLQSNAPALLSATGTSSTSIEPIQINYRMKREIGPIGLHHGPDHSSTSDLLVMPKLGVASSIAADLQREHKANQVFQFPLPLGFTQGSKLRVAFTYCANGTDCTTEFMDLKFEKPKLAVAVAPIGCPAVTFSHSLACGSQQCLVSFMNLHPTLPLDWVDMHLKSNAPLMLSSVGAASMGSAAPVVQINHRMKREVGPIGLHHGPDHSSTSDLLTMPKLGVASSVAADLQREHSANQVFQFPLPLGFTQGDKLSVAFSYCANGTDCTTEFADLHPAPKLAVSHSPVVFSTMSPRELLSLPLELAPKPIRCDTDCSRHCSLLHSLRRSACRDSCRREREDECKKKKTKHPH